MTDETPMIEPDGGFSRAAWAALIVLCGALFLDTMDLSMVGIALPSIRTDLHMSTGSLQWVVSAYALGYGGFLLLGGRAADLFGRRRMLLGALTVFVVASSLGGIAQDGTVLIAARFVKGMSAAFSAPAALSIITTTFPEGQARNKALSVFIATGATGFSLGLVFGGLLTELSWRLVFLVPAPFALAVLLGALRFVPAGKVPARSTKSFDLLGALLVTAGLLLTVFTVVEAPAAGWLSARTIGSMAAALVLLGAFLAREGTAAAPLLRLGILRTGSVARASLAGAALLGGWVSAQFVITLYAQGIHGFSALQTGLALLPIGVLTAVVSPRVAPLLPRFGVRRVVAIGLAMIALGYVLLLPIGDHSSYLTGLLPSFVLVGVGFAFAYGPLNVLGTAGIVEEEQGLAGGLLNTSLQVGGAIVLAITTAVDEAVRSGGGSGAALHGFRVALLVPILVTLLGIAAALAPSGGLRLYARCRRPTLPA